MDRPNPTPAGTGGYDLAEIDLGPPPSTSTALAPPPPAPAPPPPAAPAGPGLFGRLAGRFRKPEAPAPSPSPAEAPPAAPGTPKRKVGRREARSWKTAAPAWVVSLGIHLAVLTTMAAVAITSEPVRKALQIDAAPFSPEVGAKQADELVHILADPSSAPRELATEPASASTPGPATGLGTGSGPPSATPRVGMTTRVGERTSLPQAKLAVRLSGIAMLPAAPGRDLGGGGKIAGDVTMGTKDVGQALDQLAREILRHLEAHKLTVVWLFDESGSMKDDQRAIREKFGRVATELKLGVADRKAANVLNHAVVGFGLERHPELRKPTADIDQIGRAIDRLRVDESGVENTCTAIRQTIEEYGRLIAKDRRLLIVLVTDESGDDGQYVEEARQAAVSRGVPIYVIGRQSLFGYDRAHLVYVDPVTKETYWPAIRRGPETAGLEALQWDGLIERHDEQPSGFAPYELARIAKDSGGIYFLLPSEEGMRVRQREQAYSMETLKEYVPDYRSRREYVAARDASPLRRAMFEVIQATANTDPSKGPVFHQRIHFPIQPPALREAIVEEGRRGQARLAGLRGIEKRLRSLAKDRAREPEKRWQADYDLMLAQVVAYQVKTYEYLACLDEMVFLLKKGQLKPSQMPIPEKLDVTWAIGHATAPKAPKKETEALYAEATRLLNEVIRRHPKTPWADLAQDTLSRGLSCTRGEAHHNPQYGARAKLVPKY